MVTIRLARGGRKKCPFYHLVVTDSRHPRDGRYIERLGYYNPTIDYETGLHLNHDRISHWLSQGAKPSGQIKSLLKKKPIKTSPSVDLNQVEAA